MKMLLSQKCLEKLVFHKLDEIEEGKIGRLIRVGVVFRLLEIPRIEDFPRLGVDHVEVKKEGVEFSFFETGVSREWIFKRCKLRWGNECCHGL